MAIWDTAHHRFRRAGCGLARYASRFRRAVTHRISQGDQLEDAIKKAGKEVLSQEDPRSHLRIPRAIREKIRKLKVRILRSPLGSDEQTQLITRLNEILRKHRNKAWKRLLRKLTATQHPGEESWKIVKFLSTANNTGVGPADSDLAIQFKELFSRNQVRRPEWSHWRTLPAIPPKHHDADFSLLELQEAIRSFPNRKAPGRDGIPYEAYKALARSMPVTDMLLARYNSLLRGDHHLNYIEARALGIPKTNGKVRPLSLLPSQHKILERLCLNRILPTAKLSASQSGFRRGMNCLRPLLTLVVVIGEDSTSASVCRALELLLITVGQQTKSIISDNGSQFDDSDEFKSLLFTWNIQHLKIPIYSLLAGGFIPGSFH